MIDIRVRPVTRFILTRYDTFNQRGEELGEFKSLDQAKHAGFAFESLATADGKQVQFTSAQADYEQAVEDAQEAVAERYRRG